MGHGVEVTLTIPIKDQWPRTVQAVQVGTLAVHEPVPNACPGYKWQVTHVPTLTMFDRAIPDGDWTKEQLVNWCYEVQANHSDGLDTYDWAILNKLSHDDYMARDLLPIKERIINHCLLFTPRW